MEGQSNTTPDTSNNTGNVRLVVGLLVVTGLLYLFVAGATEGGVYFYEVDEALKQQAQKEVGLMVRIKGHVVEGSWTKKIEPKTTNEFSIEKLGQVGKSIPVYYARPTPDVFKEGDEVVVTGKFDKHGVLQAEEVTAKCPSKYDSKEQYQGMKEKQGGSY